MEGDPVVDPAKVEELRRHLGPEFPVIVDDFLRSTSERLTLLQEAADQDDWDEFLRLLHKMKGSCGFVGARALALRCLATEELHRNRKPWSCAETVADLKELFATTGRLLAEERERQ